MDETKLNHLAWLCISKGPTEAASVDLGNDEIPTGCRLSEEGRLEFSDAEEAARRAKQYIKDRAIKPNKHHPSQLFQELETFWFEAGQARAQRLHAEALSEEHNAGSLDGLQLALDALQAGGDVFSVTRVMADAFPQFEEVKLPLLLDFVAQSRALMGQDLMNGLPLNAVDSWLKRNPHQIPVVIAACVEAGGQSPSALLRISLAQAVNQDKDQWLPAWDSLLAADDVHVRQAAMEAVGLIDWKHVESRFIERAVEVLRSGLSSPDDSLIVASALAVLGMVATAASVHTLVDEVIAVDRPYIARLVGDHFAYRTKFQDLPWIWEKLHQLAGKSSAGPSSGIDHMLASFYRDHPGEVTNWVRKWAEARAEEVLDPGFTPFAKNFHELFSLLRRDHSGNLMVLLAEWLLHDSLAIQKIARQVFDELALAGQLSLAVPKEYLDGLSGPVLLLLVRRILANVFRAEQLVSMLWSFAESEDAERRTFPLLRGAFSEVVSYEYPSYVGEFLEAAHKELPQSPKKQLAEQLIQAQKKKFDALDALPTTEELRPTDDDWLRFKKIRRRSMARAMDEASKGSIIQQIATKIPLKAGRSSFSMRGGRVGEKIQLSSHSHSMLLPRSELIDPVGSAMRRFGFQMVKAGEE